MVWFAWQANSWMPHLEIQVPSLLVLIGISGAGKSSLARSLFLPTEILSSDHCRALISDSENDQSVTPQAFELLLTIARFRLALGRLCVIDATNLSVKDRQKYVQLGREARCPVSALVVDPGIDVCLGRTAGRLDRDISIDVVRSQHAVLLANLPVLRSEGYARVWQFAEVQEANSSIEVVRVS